MSTTTRLSCRICGERSTSSTCGRCAAIAALVARIDDKLLVIVDGSFHDGHGGAGLVLVTGSLTGVVVARCACRFHARSSAEAEFQAIVRGRRWAPGVPVYSDCLAAISGAQGGGRSAVYWIQPAQREPNHGIAHRLSRVGRREQMASERSRRAEIAR